MGWFTKEKPKTGWEIVVDVISKGDLSTTKEVFSPLNTLGTVAGAIGTTIVGVSGTVFAAEQASKAGVSSQMDAVNKKLGK